MGSPHLLSLAERVEAASGPSLVLDRDIALTQYPDARALPNNDARISVWDGNGRTQLTVKPYTASLDAAATLVPDGMLWMLTNTGVQNRKEPDFTKATALVSNWRDTDTDETQASTPALALCAAALKARASQPHSQTERGEA